MARSDLSIFTNYGWRDTVDKMAMDFFGEQAEDAATVAKGSAGDGIGTGVGDNPSGALAPTTDASLEAARAGFGKFGISTDGGTVERLASVFGQMGSGPDSYAQLVSQALTESGYDAGGIGAGELMGYTNGLTEQQIHAAIQGEGDQATIDQILAASSMAVSARGQAVGDYFQRTNPPL